MDRSGTPITELGFGAAGIGNLFRSVTNVEAQAAVNGAWEQGLRYFDTAPHYGAGLSERRLGLALHEKPRDELFLSTKVGRVLHPLEKNAPLEEAGFVGAAPFKRHYDYSYDGIMRAFEDSLQRLGVTRIDMLLMHDLDVFTQGDKLPELFRIAMNSGFRAMSELRDQGLVKAIGLGVNEWQVCDAALDQADFDCFMVANCFTLLENEITQHFTGTCRQREVSLIAAAPFNSGILAKGSAGAGHYFYDTAPGAVIERVIELEKVCSEYQVPLPAAAIQFPLLYPCVKSVVIGMTSEARIRQNMDWYEYPISMDFWQALVDREYIRPFPKAC
ncbi:aldo/keto reductase [Marinobacterium rhizophilum]|uniref:Aldo/keto reductase n=1 Tax=Marinobacterium rhizophilum TaxID=420402 RepID=A0ABY5HQ02_9GAMM|nr:aldo/keto reductase [Marinobacterium rhizophilum]